MSRPPAPAFDAATARQWQAAGPSKLLVALTRYVLPVSYVVIFVLFSIWSENDASPCSPESPCGSDPLWALLLSTPVVVPVLLWLSPVAGCVVGALATVGLLVEPGEFRLVGTLSLVLFAIACGRVAYQHISSRRNQRAVIDRLAEGRTATLPQSLDVIKWASAPPLHISGVLTLWCGGLALVAFFGLQTLQTLEQEQAATRVSAEVAEVSEEGGSLTLRLPDGTVIEKGTWYPEEYAVGERVPVLMDDSESPPWVTLVAEPEEHEGYLTVAVLPLALAVALTVRLVSARTARRRLAYHGAPAVEMIADVDRQRFVTFRPVVEGMPVARARLPWRDPEVPPDNARVTVAGDIRYGGQVAFLTDDRPFLPAGALQPR